MATIILSLLGSIACSMVVYSMINATIDIFQDEWTRTRNFWEDSYEKIGPILIHLFLGAGLGGFLLSLSTLSVFLGPICAAILYAIIWEGFRLHETWKDGWQGFLPNWLSSLSIKAKTLWFNFRRKRNPLEIVEAKKYQEELVNIIKGYENHDLIKPILSKINKLVKDEIPRLLKRREQLKFSVENATNTVSRQKDNGICVGEESLLEESAIYLTELQQRQKEVDDKIALILAFLDHISINASMIVDSVMARDDQGVSALISEVHDELDLLVKSHQEIDDMKDKYLEDDISARKAAIVEVKETEAIISGRQPQKAKV